MRFEAKVGERGEIVIPENVLAELRLLPETTVAVDVESTTFHSAEREPDWETLDELVARIRLPMRAALLADGYTSVDAYVNDVRGR
jgi:bifunctional DNA-binding transcriptional regulator/antitoxin component of YhaV-PrlF toxin-antitoxin module